MNSWEFLGPTIAVSVLALTVGSVLILRGPLGRAIAERLDFAERLLARHTGAERALSPRVAGR
ncbi:MAG: hypothetical protein ACREMR_01870 [Gemmatimonadales bacterium]